MKLIIETKFIKIMENLKEKLIWIEETLENLEKSTCDSLYNLKKLATRRTTQDNK